MKFELDRADADVVPFVDHRLVDFLPVHIGAVAAIDIANQPSALVVPNFRVYARAQRVGQYNLALVAAAQLVRASAVEHKMLTGTGADRHREISVFLAGCDGHGYLWVRQVYDERRAAD